MRRPLMFALTLSLAGSVGCSNHRADLVEAELRTRDQQVRELHAELMRSESMNQVLESTLREQRTHQPVMRPGGVVLVKDLQLGRGTGGFDEDKCPGDEALQVVLVPRDCDDTAVKAPGAARITVFEITPEGLKVPLSAWDVPVGQLRRSWRSGFLATGYFVTLPWQTVPHTAKLRVVAQFFPLEGGAFEAEKDVTVRIAPEYATPVMPTPALVGPPPPSPLLPLPSSDPTTLPMPRPEPPTPMGPALAPPEPISGLRWKPILPTATLGVPKTAG